MEQDKLQYDAVATNYNEEIKGQEYYEKLVNPTVRHMLGDIKGKVNFTRFFFSRKK
jgi:hypothetical protein